jgi:hypothetical protein
LQISLEALVERLAAEEPVTADNGGPVPQTRSADELLHEIAQLRQALAHRALTSQATGILAGQLDIETDLAWAVLIRLSNITNIKLRDVARVVIDRHDGRNRQEDDHLAKAISSSLHMSLARTREAAGISD